MPTPSLLPKPFVRERAGYVLKNSAGEELIAAIQEVLQGRTYLTPLISNEVIKTLAEAPPQPEAALTQRQREVLRLIAEGRRMKEIAADRCKFPHARSKATSMR